MGGQGAESCLPVGPCPPGATTPQPARLTLGTKPGATFFSLKSCHSTPASDGAACMSCRLDTRCLGSTVRSWNKAHVRSHPGPAQPCRAGRLPRARVPQGGLATRISRARQGKGSPTSGQGNVAKGTTWPSPCPRPAKGRWGPQGRSTAIHQQASASAWLAAGRATSCKVTCASVWASVKWGDHRRD